MQMSMSQGVLLLIGARVNPLSPDSDQNTIHTNAQPFKQLRKCHPLLPCNKCVGAWKEVLCVRCASSVISVSLHTRETGDKSRHR